jgi:hypothetical protein
MPLLPGMARDGNAEVAPMRGDAGLAFREDGTRLWCAGWW